MLHVCYVLRVKSVPQRTSNSENIPINIPNKRASYKSHGHYILEFHESFLKRNFSDSLENTRVFVGTVFFCGHRRGGFQFNGIFWRLTVFQFLAVSSFAGPGTGKFVGIFFGGLKYGRFVHAVPGTAKIKNFVVLFNIL